MDIKKTITTIFIVPILKFDRDLLKDNGFLNGYMFDAERDVQYPDAVYLLFKPDNLDKFRDFLDEQYESRKDILDDYDYENGFVVVVVKLDKKYKKDISIVMQGKYSEVSEKFQNLFSKTIKVSRRGSVKTEMSLQHRIFNKSTELRVYWEDKIGEELSEHMEVWPTFDMRHETLDLEKLKKELYEDV